MRNLLIVIVLCLIAGGLFYFMTPRSAPVPADTSTSTGTSTAGLANPASVNCVSALGGTLEIKDETNGQVGYCHLKDGRVCEEWALFRDNTCTAPSSGATQ